MRLNIAISVVAGLALLGAFDHSMLAQSSESNPSSYDRPDIARVRVDPGRGRTWRLTLEGILLQAPGRTQPVVVPLPGWLVAGPSDACAPDFAIGPRGEVVVTSNVIPTLWRIDPDTLAVSVHPLELDADAGRDIGFTSLRFSGAHGAYFAVSQVDGSVWKINSSLTRGEKVLADGPARQAAERSQSCDIN